MERGGGWWGGGWGLVGGRGGHLSAKFSPPQENINRTNTCAQLHSTPPPPPPRCPLHASPKAVRRRGLATTGVIVPDATWPTFGQSARSTPAQLDKRAGRAKGHLGAPAARAR
ncbi:unnamed protein product, partial [Iphiclides podalirius]